VTRWFSRSDLGLLAGQTLMEACSVWVVLRVITTLAPSALLVGFGWCVGLQLAAALTARAAAFLPVHVALQRAGLGLLELLLLWLALRSALAPDAAVGSLSALIEPQRPIGGPLTLLIWLAASFLTARGALIGAQSTEAASVRRWFLIGAITQVILYALLARGGVPPSTLPLSELQALTTAYFLGGAVVCALAERRAAHARQQLPAQHLAAFAWALALPLGALALGGAVLGASVLGVRAFMGYLQRGAVAALQLVWALIGVLARVVSFLLHALAASVGEAPAELRRAAPGSDGPEWGARLWHTPRFWTDGEALTVVLSLAVLLLCGLFLASWLRARVQARQLEVVDEDSSWLLSWSSVGQRWRARLGAISALRNRRRAVVQALQDRTRTPRDMRAIYRRVLRWAAARGHVRRAGATPLELAEELVRHFPERRHELQALTAYYNAARYGGHAASADEIDRACALLADVQRER